MRVISGKFRGKSLIAPKTDEIRPTSDRVKESIFSILASRLGPQFSGIRVLDLFAGSGALGIEAMSRGADYALFVDMAAEARGLIREHIEMLGLAGVTKLLRRDATDLGPTGNIAAFDLVFCDPPYGLDLGTKALSAARDHGWIAVGATIILEEKRGTTFTELDQFKLDDERVYGSTLVRVLRFEGPAAT